MVKEENREYHKNFRVVGSHLSGESERLVSDRWKDGYDGGGSYNLSTNLGRKQGKHTVRSKPRHHRCRMATLMMSTRQRGFHRGSSECKGYALTGGRGVIKTTWQAVTLQVD